MPVPIRPFNLKLPSGYYPSSRLHPLSRKIVDLAFQMGGSPGRFFKARMCNYVFPTGKACFDELRNDYDVDCPICRGKGAYYDDPEEVPVIPMDAQNPLSQDKYGSAMEDRIQMSVPIWVNTNVVEVKQSGGMYVVKDKLAVLDLNLQQWAIYTMDAEPFEPYLAGPLYRVVTVTSQYTQRQDDNLERDVKFYYRYQEKDLLREINEDLLNLRPIQGGYPDSEINEFPDLTNAKIIVNKPKVYHANDSDRELLDDWE